MGAAWARHVTCESALICLIELSSKQISAHIEEYHKTSEGILYLSRHSKLVAPKRKCRALQLLQFVDGTRKSMFMGFRTEQSYGQVQRELKKLGSGRKY